MTRKSTTIWIVGAVVVCGVGIGFAAHAAANPATAVGGAAASASTPAAEPAPTGSTPSGAASTPPATQPPATTAPAPSATAAPAPSTPATAVPGSPATTPATSILRVSPALSFYDFRGGTLSLGAGVSGLVDSGGTCTVTLTKGTASISRSFGAEPGPSSTDCGAMSIDSPELSTGTWSLTIRYSSPRAAGISAPTEVTL